MKPKERAAQAFRLRSYGMSLKSIAQQCGYSDKSGVFYAIRRHIATLNLTQEEAEKLIVSLQQQHDWQAKSLPVYHVRESHIQPIVIPRRRRKEQEA